VLTCLGNVRIQLIIQLGSSLVLNYAFEILIPKMLEKMEARTMKKEDIPMDKLSPAEREFLLEPYEGTIDDYQLIAIQFGYVVLFILALPLTPLIALFTNIAQTRIDAYRFVKLLRRPEPFGAGDIGTWQDVFDIMGYVAILTNMAMAAFAFNDVSGFASDLSSLTSSSTNVIWKIWLFIIAEHLIIILKMIISYAVPDVPVDVKNHIARQQHICQIFVEGAQDDEDEPELVRAASLGAEGEVGFFDMDKLDGYVIDEHERRTVGPTADVQAI